MNNETLTSERVADLQEEISILHRCNKLKNRCVSNILEIEDDSVLHYILILTYLLKRDHAEIGGAEAYTCMAFFNLVELLDQNPDEQTVKTICDVIERLR